MPYAIHDPTTFVITPTAVATKSEYSPSETLKPAKSIVASDGIGSRALSPTISRKTPTRPILSMTSTANWTSGSVMEAKYTPPEGRDLRTVRYAEASTTSPAASPAGCPSWDG